MIDRDGHDPRPAPALEDIRPQVAAPRAMIGGAAAAVGIGLAAVALFAVLEQRRHLASDRATPIAPRATGASIIAAPPPLDIPAAAPPRPNAPRPVEPAPPQLSPVSGPPAPSAPSAPSPYRERPIPIYRPPPPPPEPVMSRQPAGQPSSDPVVVFDQSLNGGESGPAAAGQEEAPVRATRLRNRGGLIPQGTLIPAVLETPIDSTKPGLARAIVTRDARGFDGSRVLIPRGSRLIGETSADVSPGQRRILVKWTRLIRPDGAAIRIASPAADSRGGTGIAGQVNTHVFDRLLNAVLQSTLSIAVARASRPGANSDSIYVGVPGQLGQAGQTLLPDVAKAPTIRARAGTEITVFVARDLDFGGRSDAR